MYLAAIIHDYGHKGVNNDFLIKTQDELALVYNDHSPMENYHISATWRMLKEDRYNFLQKLPSKALEFLRKLLIDMVLATDMKQASDFPSHSAMNDGCWGRTLRLMRPRRRFPSQHFSQTSLFSSKLSVAIASATNISEAYTTRGGDASSNTQATVQANDALNVDDEALLSFKPLTFANR